MAGRCPGQDGRNLTVSLHKCAYCGNEVEMFSDEVRVRCRQCGKYVEKDAVPSCVEWCSQARECLGDARWRALMGSRGKDAGDSSAGSPSAGGGGPGGGGPGGAGSEVGEAAGNEAGSAMPGSGKE
jgi:ribosomal protein L24E